MKSVPAHRTDDGVRPGHSGRSFPLGNQPPTAPFVHVRAGRPNPAIQSADIPVPRPTIGTICRHAILLPGACDPRDGARAPHDSPIPNTRHPKPELFLRFAPIRVQHIGRIELSISCNFGLG